MNQEPIQVGQEWYCFVNSVNYVIYKIDVHQVQSVDNKIVSEETSVHLRGTNGTTVVRRPEELNEFEWKMIKDVRVSQPADLHVTGEKTITRLDQVDA